MRVTILLLLCPALAVGQVRVTQLSDHVVLLQSPRANMVAAVGVEGSVLIGELDTLSAAAVADFRDMVKAVSDSVGRLKQAGRTVEEVIAAHPTASYDQRWGRGLVNADRFVRDVYQAVR